MSRQSTRRASTTAPALLAIAGCLASVLASPAAGHTVTIGPSNADLSANELGLGCVGTAACTNTFTQVAQPTVGLLLSAPADGVITAWHIHGDTIGSGRLALRVLHPGPDGLQFTGVATSSPVTAMYIDGSPSHPVSIPIDAGDHIGIDSTQSASGDASTSATVTTTRPSGATLGFWNAGLADGSTTAFSTRSSSRLMLNAQVALKPAVSGVSPASGATAGGEAVTIRGSELDTTTAVNFGDNPSPSFTASATQITATAPAAAAGPVHVRALGPGGASPSTDADIYTYAGPSGSGTGGGGGPTGGGATGGGGTQTGGLAPSNVFTFGSAKSLRSGYVRLVVSVPGAGDLGAQERKRKPLFKRVNVHPSRAGKVTLTLKPTAAGRKLLTKKGRFKALARVTFTPTSGVSAGQTKSLVFRKARRK